MRGRQIGLLLALTLVTACSWDATSPTPLPEVRGVGIRGGIGSATGTGAVLVGAGDIGMCGSAAAEATARLLDRIEGVVFTAGDNAYPFGSAANFATATSRTWGRQKCATRPTPGNHDYESPGAAPYFEYFGASAGPSGLGYYSYRVDDWQVYALNSNVPMDEASPQVQWLREELRLNPSTCALAILHHPLFSSGSHGDSPATQPLWQALHEAGAEVVIAGHEHFYERFAPEDPAGRLDAAGIRRSLSHGRGDTDRARAPPRQQRRSLDQRAF